MDREQWLDKVTEHAQDLISLVSQYHPGSNAIVNGLPITARGELKMPVGPSVRT